jgi:hypothetical protein
MGQHKYNKTAILAKEGKLPPKELKKSKREIEREVYQGIHSKLGYGSRLGEMLSTISLLNNKY